MGKILLLVLTFICAAVATAEEPQAEGRQMNWNSPNYANKPDYSPSYSSSRGSDDPNRSGSMLNGPASKSSLNYQGMVPQSLDGQDINRDGSYSAPSSYGSSSDYGYEAAPDTSYGNAVGYGYDIRKFPPTPSGPFYSISDPSATVPNSFLRGMPREQQDHPVSSLSSMQSGRMPYYQYQQAGGFDNNNNNSNADQMVNRAGYDEDAPLGGISSSGGSMLSGTTMRNPISRQDDLSYGTVNGGYSSIPPATGYGYGGGGINSYASPGYSSNYRSPYGGYSSYGSSASGGYGSPLYSGNYGLGGYGTYGSGGYGTYGSGGYGGSGSYGATGYGAGSSYGGGYGGGYGSYGGGYGANYGSGYYGLQPAIFKKPKKAFHDWWKHGKDIIPYGYGSGYGYGSNYAAIPYDYYYDPPGLWHLSKFAMKSIFKSMFKPIFKWLPFCSPFFYARSDRSDDKHSSFVSALTAFLPIGLFLAAIVPNIVTVSAGRRKRSETRKQMPSEMKLHFPFLT
ncbi:ice nucleation protein InaA [Daphnia magna]|uniref:ice nucleation protein InaA n=1 Tax=Daphnia magna TaxID=35525 RepID=UPI001E1BD39D|nr:ice nucleation protein InaA [Daphnia magna]